MIISRKYIKWKVLFAVSFVAVSGVLLIGSSERHTTFTVQRSDEKAYLKFEIKNGLQRTYVDETDLKPTSQLLFSNTSLDLEEPHNTSIQATLYIPKPQVASILNDTSKRVIEVLSVLNENEVNSREQVKSLWKKKNATQDGSTQNFIDYKDCATAKLMPLNTYQEFSAIVSAHGSGNTWVRYLIERATGVSTGSYYHDPKLFHGGFLGEMANPLFKNSILIKTHHPFQRKDIVFQNAIVIVRDPFEVVIAERNRVVSSNGHTSVVSDSHFRGPGCPCRVTTGSIEFTYNWEKFARGHSRYWEHSCRECITIPNYLIVYYENLKENLEFELRRMLKFLEVDPDEERIACTLAYPEGKFKRKKKERKFDPFTKELTEEINGHIRNISALFREHNIAPLPFHERSFMPVPLHDHLNEGVS